MTCNYVNTVGTSIGNIGLEGVESFPPHCVKLDFDSKDLDTWEDFYRFVKAVFELSGYAGANVRVTETAKGYHIYADVNVTNTIPLRYYYGDDDFRIQYDEQRQWQCPYVADVLYIEKEVITFDSKGRKHIVEHYTEREVDPLSVIVGGYP